MVRTRGPSPQAHRHAELASGEGDDPVPLYTFRDGVRESLVLVLLATGCYANALRGEFVFDDIIAVQENLDVRPETPLATIFEHDFWGTAITDWQSHKSYRPLTILSFRLSYYLAGYHWNELHFHLVNVIAHALVTLLALPAVRLCFLGAGACTPSQSRLDAASRRRQEACCSAAGTEPAQVLCPPGQDGPEEDATTDAVMRRRQDAAFWSAAFFATHPIHTDAVSSIVSRGEMLSGAFLLLSFLTYALAVIPAPPPPPRVRAGGPGPTCALGGLSPARHVFIFLVWLPLSVALAMVGMLCKEQAITVVALQGTKS